MGQDGEAAAELVATIRSEHVVMKTWFMGDSADAAALRKKYGPYPGLWKEVLNWPGWKEARKTYLKHQQKGESPAATKSESIPRKRRSRWGTADDSSSNNTPAATGNGAAEPPTKQRRSRWATASGAAPPPAPPPMMAPLPGLPGMPTNLPPHEQEKMRSLQARLRVINEKLQNLETEAARVDNLPRDHRERSPSPPPGTFLVGFLLFFCPSCICCIDTSIKRAVLKPITDFFSSNAQSTELMESERIPGQCVGGNVTEPSVTTCWNRL